MTLSVGIIVVVATVVSYLLGSIPTGLWLGLSLRNIDIREHGSKNIGATNTARVLGKTLGLVAFVCDVAKGMIPVAVARYGTDISFLPLACGLAAVGGHMAPVYLRFRGGKGVATAAGVFLALCPIATFAALGVFGTVFGVTRMVSAGSILAAVTLSVSLWGLHYPASLCWAGTLIALLVVLKHKSNIQRIIKGSENRF